MELKISIFKTLLLNNKNTSSRILVIFLLIFSLISTLPSSLVLVPSTVEAHFDHLAHYNGSGMGIGDKYYVNEQLEPNYAKRGELSKIQFSIQDKDGNDVHNIIVMVEVYSTKTGERLSVFPWTNLQIGDFEVPFVFPDDGNYQVVLSILNENNGGGQILNTVPPARTILLNNSGCDCERVILNVNIAENFGFIYTFVVFFAAGGAMTVLGIALFWMYYSRRKSDTNKIPKYDVIRYSVLLLAIGASVVHLAVYPFHAALRLEYSIFLISASGAQLFYGLMYIALIFATDSYFKNFDQKIKYHSNSHLLNKVYYNKTLILNLIGLGGSLVLIFLYLYAVTFPPPLSPNAHPEDVDIAGILDKSLEIVLVIGIVFLMRSEKKKYLYRSQASKYH